jgi:hypothetical protein
MAFFHQRKIRRSNIISREKFIFLEVENVKNNNSTGHSKKVSAKEGRLHKHFRNQTCQILRLNMHICKIT